MLSRGFFASGGPLSSTTSSAAQAAYIAVSLRRLFAALIVCALLPAPGAGFAETAAPSPVRASVERLEVGFSGLYKVGGWTRLRLWARASEAAEAAVVVEAPDADDDRAVIPGQTVSLKPGETQPIEAYFRTGRIAGEISIRLVDSQGDDLCPPQRLRPSMGEDAAFRPALRADDLLWVTAAALPELTISDQSSPGTPVPTSGAISAKLPHVSTLPGLAALPFEPRGCESVDVLILATTVSAPGSSLLTDLDAARSTMLRDWVRSGGHLLLSIGANAEAFSQSPLSQWLPVSIEGTVGLRQLHDLEKYSGITGPLVFSGSATAARLAPQPAANTIVQEGPNPVIVAVPFGLGRVTVVGLDLDWPPLRDWRGLPAVLKKVAGAEVTATRGPAQPSNQQLTHLGIGDLATQWQFAQEDFGNVRRPSFWAVMGLIGLYLCLIGPLDWLLIHRFLKRPGLTWVTFPGWVVLGAAVAAWGASRSNAAGLQVNQVELVDVDAKTSFVRSQAWISLYSPEDRRFKIAVEPEGTLFPDMRPLKDDGATRLSWQAPPENIVGGLYRGAGAAAAGRLYQFAAAGNAVDNLPLLQWSTRSLQAAGTYVLSQAPIEYDLETRGIGRIEGSLTHHLPVPLESCLLAVAGWAYIPSGDAATLRPDRPWRPGAQARRRDLRALLTGERREQRPGDTQHGDMYVTTIPYDPLDHNWADLVQIASFFEAAGGKEYTTLANAGARHLDLTGLMRLGCGVLIGRVGPPANRVTVDGQPAEPAERHTYVRFVFPVTQREGDVERTLPSLDNRNPPASQPRNKK